MSELTQLKNRIAASGMQGVKTSQIRDDYEPIGGQMIRDLVDTGEYVTRRIETGVLNFEWRIFTKEWDPE